MVFLPSQQSDPTLTHRLYCLVHPKGLVLKNQTGTVSLPTEQELSSLDVDFSTALPLGRLNDCQVFAMEFPGPLPPSYEAFRLRALATLLPLELFQVAGSALHVIDWVTTSRFCGRCGTRTTLASGERSMVCPSCTLTIYPRIAPAVIVLVRRGDEALLAHNTQFPSGLYSALAGFSEIGESLEETVHREIREEVGIEVDTVRYFGSQPWPAPNSLMIAFTARWVSGEIVADATEIADARWFSRTQLPELPMSFSIARKLVDAWLAGDDSPSIRH